MCGARAPFVVLLLLLITVGCDLGDPDKVSAQAAQTLSPYFPNVRAFADPKSQQVIALTCTSGAGTQLVDSIMETMRTGQSLDKFNQLRALSAFTRTQSYGSFILGFENDVIVYNVDQKELFHKGADQPGYRDWYRKKCFGQSQREAVDQGDPANTGVPDVTNTRARQYAMMGVWDISYTLNGVAKTTTWYDTLGAYGSGDRFQQFEAREVKAREAWIYESAAARNWEVVSLSLNSVHAVPVAAQYMTKSQQ